MLIFLDVETTGLESDDRIISIGIVYDEERVYELLKPENRRINIEAMAIHHITNEMLSEAKGYEESTSKVLLEKLNKSENIIVSHNIAFDVMMLEREGFHFKGEYIDTLRVSRHLMKETPSHALQYLRYEIGLYKEEEMFFAHVGVNIQAHNALSDALHVKMLYEYLLTLSDNKTMILLSNQPVLLEKFSFGKYKNRYIEEVSMADRGYLEWMLHTLTDLDEDLRYSIEYYLGGHF